MVKVFDEVYKKDVVMVLITVDEYLAEISTDTPIPRKLNPADIEADNSAIDD